jgi:hypothetical protein
MTLNQKTLIARIAAIILFSCFCIFGVSSTCPDKPITVNQIVYKSGDENYSTIKYTIVILSMAFGVAAILLLIGLIKTLKDKDFESGSSVLALGKRSHDEYCEGFNNVHDAIEALLKNSADSQLEIISEEGKVILIGNFGEEKHFSITIMYPFEDDPENILNKTGILPFPDGWKMNPSYAIKKGRDGTVTYSVDKRKDKSLEGVINLILANLFKTGAKKLRLTEHIS